MFGRRCGHYSSSDTGNRSPVFLQFLDCVHQIWHQMSSQFEFNDKLLVFIAEELHTCKFGTFFFNSQQERMQFNLPANTLSIWTEVQIRKDTSFKNPFYHGEGTLRRLEHVPTVDDYNLRLWREYFFRYIECEYDEVNYVKDAET